MITRTTKVGIRYIGKVPKTTHAIVIRTDAPGKTAVEVQGGKQKEWDILNNRAVNDYIPPSSMSLCVLSWNAQMRRDGFQFT
jgi:hypothetical protein